MINVIEYKGCLIREISNHGNSDIDAQIPYYFSPTGNSHNTHCKTIAGAKRAITKELKEREKIDSIQLTRINNDTNGNPRYVCHWLSFKPNAETYEQALYLAKKLGGRKFHNKQYGGGIVFHLYNIAALGQEIVRLANDK
jgi:hypothetical protein